MFARGHSADAASASSYARTTHEKLGLVLPKIEAVDGRLQRLSRCEKVRAN
jgi:hypothetical protein